MKISMIIVSTVVATVVAGATIAAVGTYAFVNSGLYDVSAILRIRA